MPNTLNRQELERLERFVEEFPQWDAAPIELKIGSAVYFLTQEIGRPCVVSTDVERLFQDLAEPLTVYVHDLFTNKAGKDYIEYVHKGHGFALSRSHRQYIESLIESKRERQANKASATVSKDVPTNSLWRRIWSYLVEERHKHIVQIVFGILASVVAGVLLFLIAP